VDGIYWLVPLLVIAAAIAAYARYWYYRPSAMSEVLTASYSYQILDYIDFRARRAGEDFEEFEISTYHITSIHMKGRELNWRERNDIIRYMKRMGWVYEVDEHGTNVLAISRAGKQELETAYGLSGAVTDAAQTLHNKGISGDQAKATAAAVVAGALRVHARSASSENPEREKASADQIEEAARARDPEKIDRTITRTKDILQIVTLTVPAMRDILRMFGWL
jgi:hypothetical protein